MASDSAPISPVSASRRLGVAPAVRSAEAITCEMVDAEFGNSACGKAAAATKAGTVHSMKLTASPKVAMRRDGRSMKADIETIPHVGEVEAELRGGWRLR